MNKKFSTLAVAAMLASAFTAYAGPGDVVTKLAEGNNGKQYQLRAVVDGTAVGFLTLAGHDGALEITPATELSEIGESLWCVDVTLENQGKNPIFDFTNKAYGSYLDVTVSGWETSDWNSTTITGVSFDKKEAHVGGEVRGWKFAPALGSDEVNMFDHEGQASALISGGISEKNAYSLVSYISSNEVATLIYQGGKIRVAVLKADDLANTELAAKQIKFFLQEASPIDLTADQFNSILNTQDKEKGTVKMTFDKDYNNTDIVNPFSSFEFRAEAITSESGISCSHDDCELKDNKHNFVYLYKTETDATKSYLRVDTAYANGYGTKFLTFAFGSKFGTDKKSTDPADEVYIPDQYKFRLNYCPTDDSLSIQVKEVLYKVHNASESPEGAKWWREGNTVLTGGDNGLKEEFYTRNWEDGFNKAGSWIKDQKLGNANWVKLQDLETAKDSRIVTIGQTPINTHISFGYGDCANVASEFTSVEDGVYYIKNAKGQYLAHPIYNNGESAPLFVTVNANEQEVAHMPAYQWVVLKKYTSTADSKKTSPVMIANREFDNNFKYTGVQLKQAAGATYMYVTSAVKYGTDVVIAKTDSVTFEAVPAESVKDKYLGYKKINSDTLKVNKYTFNYWHPYASDKFIAQSDKDSTLTVLNGKSAFGISEINDLIGYDDNNDNHKSAVDIKYGFAKDGTATGFTKFEDIQKRIPGLAQLVRTVYEVNLSDSYLKVNTNDQFNVGADKYNKAKYDQSGERYFVFFKENNHVDGKDYYAIVRAKAGESDINYDGETLSPTIEYTIAENKAGVSDYDGAATLKNQVLEETRTSSFAIAADETPLYRRFNSAALEGQAGDGVDTLRFYEKYRNEYLMIEANPNFMVEHIDFLGIDAQDKAQGGLAFIVDTAWVNRGAGNLKPQYLISIDRHDFAGTPGVPCTYEHNHFDNQGNAVDAEHCSHAIPAVPGFARGKYLINFHNFAAANKDMVKTDDYKWAEYDRAGFKEAVVVADTLYVLRDEFKNLPNEDISVAKLAAAEDEAKKAYIKENGVLDGFLTYKYVLSGDEHKYATWSMRFVDRAAAANEVEADRAFLFESMKYKNANDPSKDDKDIAPSRAAWLKMQNGCLVLSDEKTSKFDEVVTGGDDALIFNVAHVDGDQVAVDNENIAVEGVSVVAGNGQITIMGAAGKNVTITNILGKVIANQTIASDNATIAVPAGIVAVAVEGEAAVKAIVK